MVPVLRVRIPHSDDLLRGTWRLNDDGQPGDVNASIACFEPCTYHVWATLTDWVHGKKEAGQPVTQYV